MLDRKTNDVEKNVRDKGAKFKTGISYLQSTKSPAKQPKINCHN
jgi:hypothetical protein